MSDEIGDHKGDLRRRMREARKAVDDPEGRSIMIWSQVRDEPAVRSARTILCYESVPGEPDTASFIEWCRETHKQVVVPEADPSAAPPDDPAALDVVIVPGIAFTAAGDRLGQGGGWFDRLLAEVRDDCLTIGVCFGEQLVDDLPTEPHDVRLHRVIAA